MKFWKPCKQCKATGYTGNFRVCPKCKGRGFVIYFCFFNLHLWAYNINGWTGDEWTECRRCHKRKDFMHWDGELGTMVRGRIDYAKEYAKRIEENKMLANEKAQQKAS